MALKELAEATLHNMNLLGGDTYADFAQKMTKAIPGHKMARSIKATILSDKPYFGTCRIGKVEVSRVVKDGKIILTELQFYIANFDSIVDTSTAALHTPRSNNFGSTYFAVVIDINETTGRAEGFNKKYGKDGVVFQTGNEEDAIVMIGALSSGKKKEEVAALLARAKAEQASAARR